MYHPPRTNGRTATNQHDPAYLWPGYASRAASFENPAALPHAGGSVAGGRKGAPQRMIAAGERVVLADLTGPGRVGHLWLTVGSARRPGRFDNPALLRAQLLEVFYDGRSEPSVSVPAGDFFGAVHGIPAPFASALTAVNEGRGFVSRVPLPFRQRLRIEYQNCLDEPVILYYQVDVLLGPQPEDCGLLHATFRRENPTTRGKDFVIAEGLTGPGRFLGWTGGVRVLDGDRWWGEGEVKFFIDSEDSQDSQDSQDSEDSQNGREGGRGGDHGEGAARRGALPTICGTGSEDYLDSAWGLGTFAAPESGAPLVLSSRGPEESLRHDLAGFYRWHLSDPIVFARELRATVQQIGMAMFPAGQEQAFAEFRERNRPAGNGWAIEPHRSIAGMGLYERADDWCATAFLYLRDAQPVAPLDVALALQDLAPIPGRMSVHRPPIPDSLA